MSGVRGVSKARLMRQNSENRLKYQTKFDDLVQQPFDAQAAFFTKSFIFALGDKWKDVSDLSARFQKYLGDQNEARDLDPVAAADFLQKNGKPRTATERRAELADIDLDHNDRVGLTEMLLLLYKECGFAPADGAPAH